MATSNGDAGVEIPKTCKAGVVENEGPDFKLVVEDVPVPEPGRKTTDISRCVNSMLILIDRPK